MIQYDYNKSAIVIEKLAKEITTSNITIALDHIILFGSILSILFKSDLSNEEKTTLDSLVEIHIPIPLPDSFVQNVNIITQPATSPFASKVVETKKLYKRLHGITQNLLQGTNDILFTLPYPWVKITGLEVINSEALDKVSLYVLDTTSGTYSTIPNYIFNQFAFDVNLTKDYYIYKSEFDADLHQNMQIKIVYQSNSNKPIGINLILNEVK